MMGEGHIRPFERMQFMRGSENLYVDLALEDEHVYRLAEMLHEFFLREVKMLAETAVDGISFMDDWGSQQTLLINPKLWCKLFKPMYKDYIDIIHKKGKFAFFHSDGNIELIYPHLVELGVDAVNSQLFCMNIEKLAENYGDKITFWGEIDRQNILPGGDVAAINAAVDRVAAAVYKKNGKRTGAFAQCEWGNDVTFDSMAAVFERWNQK
jgi:uroporphyrinogen-III decarboxylase